MELKNGRKVYIKEFDTYGMQYDLTIICNDWNSFFSVWDIPTLTRCLETAEEQENYEIATIIKNHIDRKTNPC